MEKTNGMVPVELKFLDLDKRGHFWVRAYIRKSDRDILLEKENNADLGYLSALDLNPPKRKRRPEIVEVPND